MRFITNSIEEKNEHLLSTFTGEFVQPVRVYYDLKDKNSVKKVFSKLKCMEFDSTRDRQVWLYQKESKKIKFKKTYSSIPLKQRPIIIGSFFIKNNNEMYLEARSIERALEGIIFFDKYIKKYMALVTDICIINKLFSGSENTANFDSLFAEAVIIDPDKNIDEINSFVDQGKSIGSYFEKTKKKALPLVERFPSYFYEDGIEILNSTLQSRQYVAMQHWKGDKDYTLGDYISKILSLY